MKSILPTVVLLLTLAASARAQTVGPVPAPTIITTAPYTITSAGYYQLGANLVYTGSANAIITIASPNVTLDLAGHFISGPSNTPGTQLYGVYAYEVGNLTIQNGTIANCFTGVLLAGNGSPASLNYNQRVNNVLVTYCYSSGIELTAASNSVIANNRISFIVKGTNSTHVEGIYDNAGVGNIADSNIITNVTTGSGVAAGIAGALTNTVSSLTVTNNRISNVTNSSFPALAIGIYEGSFVVRNTINNANQAVYTAGKYQDNLTYASTSPFGGGTDGGGNN